MVDVLKEIELLGFKAELDAQYDLSKLDIKRRVQVREPRHYAPRDAVEKYAVQMAYSKFPPIIVTSDAWLVDGNTRVAAVLKRKEKFFPAYVLNVVFKARATPDHQRHLLSALATQMNARNGTPLTAKEIRMNAEKFIHLGWKTDRIAEAIGLKGASISLVKREIEAESRLKRVGIDDSKGELKGTSLRALGESHVLALNDAPYKAIALLAADAGLNATEIVATAKEVKAVGSEDGQLDRLEALRQEHATRISTRRLTGIGRPPAAAALRQRLGFIRRFLGKENELVETSSEARANYIVMVDQAIDVLTSLNEMQRVMA